VKVARDTFGAPATRHIVGVAVELPPQPRHPAITVYPSPKGRELSITFAFAKRTPTSPRGFGQTATSYPARVQQLR
jgi:hypothetical protein